MLTFLVSALVFFVWIWFSLSPGAALGFALFRFDWRRLWRDLDQRELQTKNLLRRAAWKSWAINSTLIALAMATELSRRGLAKSPWIAVFLGGLAGLGLGLVALLYSTRPGGWYGED